jgi:UDP-N-acetylmuramyl pentapeptide phosphotransferase/UDP-N-acetylglucosamine-1-phosphate transferase
MPTESGREPTTMGTAILWFLCCLPIGFSSWGQGGKGWLWILIAMVPGGGLVAWIDYWMCYSAQQKRDLEPMEFFPR